MCRNDEMRVGDLIQFKWGGRDRIGLLLDTSRICDRGPVPVVHFGLFLPDATTERKDPRCTLHIIRIRCGWKPPVCNLQVEHGALAVTKNLTREMCARKIQRWWRVHRTRAELLRALPGPAAELVMRKLRDGQKDDREDVWLHGYDMPCMF